MRRLFPIPVIPLFLFPSAVVAGEGDPVGIPMPAVAIDLSGVALQVQHALRADLAMAVLAAAGILLAGYWRLGYPRDRQADTAGDLAARQVLALWSGVGALGFLGAAVLLHRVCFWMGYGGH